MEQRLPPDVNSLNVPQIPDNVVNFALVFCVVGDWEKNLGDWESVKYSYDNLDDWEWVRGVIQKFGRLGECNV